MLEVVLALGSGVPPCAALQALASHSPLYYVMIGHFFRGREPRLADAWSCYGEEAYNYRYV